MSLYMKPKFLLLLRLGGGQGGNNVPMIVDTLVFDESQITSPINGNVPTWGGCVTHYRKTPEGQ